MSSIPNTQMELSPRRGPRPRTGPSVPHEQLDQIAPTSLQDTLWRRMASLPHVMQGPSRISTSDRALHLPPSSTTEGAAFMVDTEFAHLHRPHDGSLHLTLPHHLRRAAIDQGWAEPHPLAGRGTTANLVMVYGPRDDVELEAVWELVQACYQFASGELR